MSEFVCSSFWTSLCLIFRTCEYLVWFGCTFSLIVFLFNYFVRVSKFIHNIYKKVSLQIVTNCKLTLEKKGNLWVYTYKHVDWFNDKTLKEDYEKKVRIITQEYLPQARELYDEYSKYGRPPFNPESMIR